MRHGCMRAGHGALAAVAVLFAVAALAGAPAPAAARSGPVPGVVAQDPVGGRDLARMHRGGARTLRFLVVWAAVEPAPGVYDWAQLDRLVAGAARHRIDLLPFVWGTPPWIASSGDQPPIGSPAALDAWQTFLTAIADRYGRGGSFWEGRARIRPIRRWQIWNEPNFAVYWRPPISASGYATLLDAAATAIRAADPRARIVTAGIAPVGDGEPWDRFLLALLEVPGVRRDFDYLALHPYAARPRSVLATAVRARAIMAARGAGRKPLAITEVGWGSGGAEAPMVVGRRRQARNLTRTFRLLGGDSGLRVSDVDWFAWRDATAGEDRCRFCRLAGLFDLDGDPKASWQAFREAARSARSPG